MKPRQILFMFFVLSVLIFSYAGCDILNPSNDEKREPAVQINKPSTNDIVSGAVKIDVTATAYENSPNNRIDRVQVAVDGNYVGEATQDRFGSKPKFYYIWDSQSVADGVHFVQVQARDSDGGMATSSIKEVEVENGLNNGPLATISQPAHGSEIFGITPVRISKIPNEPEIIRVDLLIDGIFVRTLNQPNYEYLWDTQLSDPGTYILQAKTYGVDGRIRLSMPIQVTVTGG